VLYDVIKLNPFSIFRSYSS